jgi:hypothetical protein
VCNHRKTTIFVPLKSIYSDGLLGDSTLRVSDDVKAKLVLHLPPYTMKERVTLS